MRVVFTAAADEEVESARAWYETERPGLGDELLAEAARLITVIADHPLHFRVVRHGLRRALVHRFPYAI
ncbi:MAG: type II toxin-antitoxin system RelE/ParE family toxin [Planctomycetota bacterium]